MSCDQQSPATTCPTGGGRRRRVRLVVCDGAVGDGAVILSQSLGMCLLRRSRRRSSRLVHEHVEQVEHVGDEITRSVMTMCVELRIVFGL